MIMFDVLHPYYLPQYLPVRDELIRRGIAVRFVIYRQVAEPAVTISRATSAGLECSWVDNVDEAIALYQHLAPRWVIFGNRFEALDKLHACGIKTALMQHGIGPKACYYEVSAAPFTVRFVEGQARLERLQSLFPERSFVDTGYAKLDPVINGTINPLDFEAMGLERDKSTLLYAPTFNPSSILAMAKDWPADFADYNILLKPHYFSLVKSAYRAQRRRLMHWADFDNVYLVPAEQTCLTPYMASADLLISDASSALFEFAVLDKPVVWCDFFHLKWSYRGIFSYRLDRRLGSDRQRYADIGAHAGNYADLLPIVRQQLVQPGQYAARRQAMTRELAGRVDGLSSVRIADWLQAGY